ncbi:MAG: hypothetical protein K0Q50_1819, partial [Vampirovibrio sp.]|nr:hypothetical protein [Vampirovibrio sp.]
MFSEDSQSKRKVKHQTETQVKPFTSGRFLSVNEAAVKLEVTPKTVREWCQTGRLPAIPKPYGNKVTFLISPQAVEMALSEIMAAKQLAVKAQKVAEEQKKSHSSYLSAWGKAMRKGLLTGKVFSPRTADNYESYAKPFLEKYQEVTSKNLQAALLRIASERYATRH